MNDQEELDGMAAYYHAIQNPSRDDPNWPLPSFDAQDWAKAFCDKFPGSDEGLMLTWFANALMRGYDEATMRLRAERAAARDAALEDAALAAEEKARWLVNLWHKEHQLKMLNESSGANMAASAIRALKGPKS